MASDVTEEFSHIQTPVLGEQELDLCQGLSSTSFVEDMVILHSELRLRLPTWPPTGPSLCSKSFGLREYGLLCHTVTPQ